MSTLLDVITIQAGEEAVEGTEVATYSPWPGKVKKDGIKLTTESEEILIDDISSINEAEDIIQGNKTYQLEIPFRVQSLIFLYWFFGTLTSETGTNPYTHTVDPLVGRKPSLSIEIVLGNGDFSLKFLGSKITEMKFPILNNQELVVTLKLNCKSMSVDVTPGSPTQLSTAIYSIAESSTLSINSASYLTKCEKAEYTFFQTMNADYGLDDIEPAEINEGGGNGCTVQYEIRVTDETLYNLWINNTNFPISHIVQRGGSANDQFTITIAESKTSKPSWLTKGGGGAFKIALPVRTIGDLQFVIVDAISTYSNPQ